MIANSTFDYIDPDFQILNLAAISPSTRSLGPGVRAAVWVQGCPIHCPGCIAPEWIPLRPAKLTNPISLAEVLLEDPAITGLTLSGGEPMLQAVALSLLVRRAREIRDIDVICFSGYRLAQLHSAPPSPGVEDLLNQIDVLIDGPYLAAQNNNRGLRGSANQQIHHLTDRLRAYPFEIGLRSAEIHILDGQVMMVGVPSKSLNQAFTVAINRAQTHQMQEVFHERT